MLTNEETERLFGMTYSAVSHILSSMRTEMQKILICGLNTTTFIHYSRCDTKTLPAVKSEDMAALFF